MIYFLYKLSQTLCDGGQSESEDMAAMRAIPKISKKIEEAAIQKKITESWPL